MQLVAIKPEDLVDPVVKLRNALKACTQSGHRRCIGYVTGQGPAMLQRLTDSGPNAWGFIYLHESRTSAKFKAASRGDSLELALKTRQGDVNLYENIEELIEAYRKRGLGGGLQSPTILTLTVDDLQPARRPFEYKPEYLDNLDQTHFRTGTREMQRAHVIVFRIPWEGTEIYKVLKGDPKKCCPRGLFVPTLLTPIESLAFHD